MNSWEQALDWLYGTQLFGVKLGLEPVMRLLDRRGIRISGPGAARFIHVAGTNGKGSTCAMIDAMCRAAGLRTGLYTSPHLVRFNERMRLNGVEIPDGEALEILREMRVELSGWDPHPTFFEITTVLALEWFQRRGAEVVVLETGMGGRLDATNVVTPVVSVITPIGLDHQKYLGDTLAQIAGEKAGILKRGVPAVSAVQSPEAREVIEAHAVEKECSLTWSTLPWTQSPVRLQGVEQLWNAALAVAAVDAARLEIPFEAKVAGLAAVEWPGRFQRILPDLVLDGAHNPHAASALAESWRSVFPGEKATLIFGALADKEVAPALRALRPIVGEVRVVPVQSPRALPLSELRSLACAEIPGVPCAAFENLAGALAAPAAHRRLLTGSLFLVGEALAHLQGRAFEQSAQ